MAVGTCLRAALPAQFLQHPEVVCHRFNESSGTNLPDLSGNGNNAVVTEALAVPQNVAIGVSNGYIFMSWDPVLGAASYRTNSDANPGGVFSFEQWSGTGTSWSEAILDPRKFYRVTPVR